MTTPTRSAAPSSITPATRAAFVPPGYSAAAHVARTTIIAAVIGTAAVLLARRAARVDWLLVPVFFVVANAIEWLVHRGPMHRPLPPRIMYQNHALLHHKAFHEDSMRITEARELQLIMMPWATMLGLFVVASPVALAFAWWRGVGAVGIFYLCAAGYFVLYETLHALYHAPEAVIGRLGVVGAVIRWMAPHHRLHHRLDRMAHANFNVTFPIMDWLMGTKEREAEAARERGAVAVDTGARPL